MSQYELPSAWAGLWRGGVRKSIAIDLDTVLNNLNEVWLERYNADYKDNVTNADLKTWDIASFVKCGANIYDYLKEPGFFRNLKPQPYAIEATKWMAEHFDLCIATAYVPQACLDKAEWVDEYFPHIGSNNIIFCNDKGKILTDYLIDDGGHNIEAFKGRGIVYDQPYNEYLIGYPRVSNWLEIQAHFMEVAM